nr:hypothetical protein [Streptomyces sp. RLB1-33]QIY67924.1 hypothetical protein HEP84_19520 [Streptomyces sp. RLB1-33]
MADFEDRDSAAHGCLQQPGRLLRVATCPQMDTAIQIGPTGKKLLPLTVKNAGPAPAPSGHAH